MLYSMLGFLENEENRRKLKKVEELVQHFSEECRHYIGFRTNIRTDEKMKYEEDRKKERRETVAYTNIKQASAKFVAVLCGVQVNAGKNTIYTKKT